MRCEIKTKNLKVAYGDFVALDCGTFSLAGTSIAILGHNGAGKSTLIKALLGLLSPQTGNIEIFADNGLSLTLLSPEKHMAFCPETGAVFEDIPVRDYIKLWCRIKHGDGLYYKKEGWETIKQLDIVPLLKKLGRELSKGQRRRVQTAIGYLTKPRLFLFDEPFDGLDVQKTSELADIIDKQAVNMCSIISSHRMDVVERLADSALVLQEGKIAAAGSLHEVCCQLCGRSLEIKNALSHEALAAALKEAFSGAVVAHLGSELRITGKNLQLDEVRAFVQSRQGPSAIVDEVRPSLTDAMNYHLKSIAGETSANATSTIG